MDHEGLPRRRVQPAAPSAPRVGLSIFANDWCNVADNADFLKLNPANDLRLRVALRCLPNVHFQSAGRADPSLDNVSPVANAGGRG
jgi:hypothetical protein